MSGRALATLTALAVAFGAGATPTVAAPAPAPAPAAAQTSVADLEDEVMCPICGTLLELAESPQAQRQRAFIAKLVAEGRGKEEIKDELVVEYGREVLAAPEGSGFQLSAYLVPAIAFGAAVVALVVGVLRWRRRPPYPGGAGNGPPSGEAAERLDADLSRYDL
jgi:cytochrome c-type biogenesis protein CcmH